MTIFTTPAALGGFTIRTLGPVDRPVFIVTDIAKVLGRAGVSRLSKGLADDEKGLSVVQTPGGPQKLGYVTEAGLYRILMRSNSPNARAFQDWLARDVLPEIRKSGVYAMAEEKLNDPNLSLNQLDALIDRMMVLMQAIDDVLKEPFLPPPITARTN
jgi:prophage antirepressor-like protein